MQPRETDFVYLDEISIVDRLRTPTDDDIDRLTRSIEEIGLQCPIILHDTDEKSAVLVTGITHLNAVERLGCEKIEVFWLNDDCSDIEAEMLEIAENLHRTELTALQRSEQVDRWRKLW